MVVPWFHPHIHKWSTAAVDNRIPIVSRSCKQLGTYQNTLYPIWSSSPAHPIQPKKFVELKGGTQLGPRVCQQAQHCGFPWGIIFSTWPPVDRRSTRQIQKVMMAPWWWRGSFKRENKRKTPSAQHQHRPYIYLAPQNLSHSTRESIYIVTGDDHILSAAVVCWEKAVDCVYVYCIAVAIQFSHQKGGHFLSIFFYIIHP